MVIVPTLLDSVDAVAGAARASRGAGARQPRSAYPLRAAQRLSRRRRRNAAAATPRSWPRRAPASRRSTRKHADGGDDRFFLFHRAAPMERARRAVDGMGAQARQDRGVQPPAARRHRHELRRHRSATCRSCRRCAYCITLDSDTRLPRDVARELIGIIAHPLNRPAFDARARPRHRRLRHPPAARSASRSRARPGRSSRGSIPDTPGVDPVHDGGLGHVSGPVRRRHLHRQGPLRRRRVQRRARRIRCPRTRCCRTICSKDCTRASALVSDVELVDEYPVERADARAAAAPLDSRRLADPVLAVPVRAVAARPQAQHAAADRRAGRFSTTCAAAWSRRRCWRCWSPAGRCCPALAGSWTSPCWWCCASQLLPLAAAL